MGHEMGKSGGSSGGGGSGSASATNATAKSAAMSLSKSTTHAVGHGLFLGSALLYLLSSWTPLYRVAALASAAAYAVATFHAISTTTFSWEGLLLNKNAPYLALSAILYLMRPISFLLLPLLVYSLYAVTEFARSSPAVGLMPWWQQWGRLASDQLLSVQPAILSFATNLEILAMPWLLFSIFGRQGTFWAAIMYSQILRWLYFVNPRMGPAIAQWDGLLMRLTTSVQCPLVIRRGYQSLRATLQRYARAPVPAANIHAAAGPSRSRY